MNAVQHQQPPKAGEPETWISVAVAIAVVVTAVIAVAVGY
jgi:hypothetical protein